MAAYLGAPEEPIRDEDTAPDNDRPIPSLEAAEKQISPKTKALMDELFRAKLEKVQRINPNKIR